jgi:tetratricopeptide (TPR) repeat protein
MGVSPEDQGFLVEPMRGYPLLTEPDREERVRRLARAFQGGALETASAGVAALLEEDPGFHPAVVLQAQLHFVAGRFDEAEALLAPVLGELPAYTAAQLLSARLAERRGDLPAAYAAYRAVEGDALAAERATVVQSRAVEIVANRLEAALQRGRPDQAEGAVRWLERWVPGEEVTLEAVWRLARDREDSLAEAEALDALLPFRLEDRDLLLRRSELAFVNGRPRRGVEILRSLVAAHPEDSQLAEKLDEGKLRLRVSLLPGEVQGVSQQTALSRSDYALLLYWLMPGVRSARSASPRIAADILEHPQREAIARVINQRLMDVDETLHRFSPDAGVTRRDALASLLRILAQGGETALPACLGRGMNPRPSTGWICETAARCGLLGRGGECLADAPVSGAVALEWMRRTLRQLDEGAPQ